MIITGTCKTLTGAGSHEKGEDKDCVFPFKIGSTTYNGCTTDIWSKAGIAQNGQPWCATKLRNGKIKNKNTWGYCNENCPTAQTTEVTTSAPIPPPPPPSAGIATQV